MKKKINKNYFTIKTYLAGLSLEGKEVRLIRNNNFKLKNTVIFINKNEIFFKKFINIDNKKNTKLLLKKKEIINIINIIKKKKYKIIPIKLLNKEKIIKLKIAIVLKKTLKKNIKNKIYESYFK